MTGASDTALLARALGGFRMRLRRVLVLRYLWIALAGAIVATEALALWFGTGIVQTLLLFGAMTVVATTAADLVAVLRTPSLFETARLIDRRESLQNRAATALQFTGEQDIVAALVVRDASRHVSALDPVQVFPREYPARLRLLVSAVGVISLLFAFAVSRGAQISDVGVPGSSGIVSTGAASHPRSGSPARPATDMPTAAPPQGSTVTPTPGLAQAQPGERADASPAPSNDDSARAGDRRSRPGSSSPSSRTSPNPVQARQPPAAPGANVESPDARGTDVPGVSATGRTGRLSAGAREGVGAGGTTAGHSARQGGGVKEGAFIVQPPRDVRARESASPADYAVEYGAAWSRAQTAIAQDRIPPELREYVRRYFAAIRSPRQP